MSGSANAVMDGNSAQAGIAPATSTSGPSVVGQLSFEQLVAVAERLAADRGQGMVIALYRGWIAAQPVGAPHLYAAWFNLGAELSRTGEMQAAMLSYRNALALRPDFALAAINLGLLQERCGDEAGALRTWSQATQPDEARTALHQPAGTASRGQGAAGGSGSVAPHQPAHQSRAAGRGPALGAHPAEDVPLARAARGDTGPHAGPAAAPERAARGARDLRSGCNCRPPWARVGSRARPAPRPNGSARPPDIGTTEFASATCHRISAATR